MTIINWKIYCDTENEYVSGYLNSEGKPHTCFNNNTHSIDPSKSSIIEKIYTNHTAELSEWKVFCTTEDTYVSGFLNSNLDEPNICFNNNTHVITRNLTKLVNRISNINVSIKEEDVETGRHFAIFTKIIDIPAGVSGATDVVSIHDVSWPFPISMVDVFFSTDSTHSGDRVTALVGPNTTIGVITAGVTAGVTSTISVNSTVNDNIDIGMFVTLTNGVTSTDLGCVIGKNFNNSEITTEFISDVSFDTGSYVQITLKMMNNFYLLPNKDYILGANKIGASHVPANTLTQVCYTNHDGLAKRFVFNIEYLY
jgi:hypothetical protein